MCGRGSPACVKGESCMCGREVCMAAIFSGLGNSIVPGERRGKYHMDQPDNHTTTETKRKRNENLCAATVATNCRTIFLCACFYI